MSRFGHVLLGVATLALMVTGCGRSPQSTGGPEIGSAAYIAAVEPFLPPLPHRPPADERGVVFVVPLDGRALPLEVQIEVVGAFADDYDIRFVDDVDAAIDERAPHHPPQEGGLLIGMAPVTAVSPHSTRIELYWSDDVVEGHLVTLALTDDGWQVTGDESVTPETLSRHD